MLRDRAMIHLDGKLLSEEIFKQLSKEI